MKKRSIFYEKVANPDGPKLESPQEKAERKKAEEAAALRRKKKRRRTNSARKKREIGSNV